MKPDVFVFSLDSINNQGARDFAVNLVNWSRSNAGKPVRVEFNSGGGNILDGLFLYEKLNWLRAQGHHLTGVAYGRMASSAAWLLQACDWRIIGTQSWLLVHEVQSRAEGPISSVRRELERMIALQEQTTRILTSRTQGRLVSETIGRHIDGGRDWWIAAAEAYELGLVDEIETVKPFAGKLADETAAPPQAA